MMSDTSRLICGVATVFDRPSQNNTSWPAEAFEDFLRLEIAMGWRICHRVARH
jgi:hypothetical protein